MLDILYIFFLVIIYCCSFDEGGSFYATDTSDTKGASPYIYICACMCMVLNTLREELQNYSNPKSFFVARGLAVDRAAHSLRTTIEVLKP